MAASGSVKRRRTQPRFIKSEAVWHLDEIEARLQKLGQLRCGQRDPAFWGRVVPHLHVALDELNRIPLPTATDVDQ